MRAWQLSVVVVSLALAACGRRPPESFDTPESVLHDAVDDVYLVSNIHGGPLAKDDNGYIARIDPVSGAGERYWIQGGRDGVTLHAPKGMALVGDVLWVADIDVVRKFDRKTGRPLGHVAIPGAGFLNDVAADVDGTVFVTDTGLDAAFAKSGTDAIWRIAGDGTATALAKGTELAQPNGIVAKDGGCYVVSWADGSFYQVDGQGRRTPLAKAPSGGLDGLVRVVAADGSVAYYATSWESKGVVRFDVTGGCTVLPTTLEQPADCAYDAGRRLLVVPLFGENRIASIRL
ncbi:MAG: hypothetical protein RL398_783 [Planctomycetota bacterium]|jgi:hypothetical protein